MEREIFDVIVIGGGPGGYVAAIRAAQRNAKVALIEAKEMGGTCLNRGCIPSKTLIANADVYRKVKGALHFGIHVKEVSLNYAQMKEQKDKIVERIRKGLEGLIKSNKIHVFQGFGKFISENVVKVTGSTEAVIEGKNIIIATGSEPRLLSQFPLDYKTVHDSTSLLEMTSLPKKLIVIGGGIIGCEFASLYRELGVDVTILELLPSIISLEGKTASEALTAAFKRRGIKIETGVSVTGLTAAENEARVTLGDGRTLDADCVLVSVGRALNTAQIGLETTGVIVEKNGVIPTNEKLQTNVPHIYAIGDITGKMLLAHLASHQGLVAADNATHNPSKIHYKAIPSVIYTHPEIASVGLTLEKALEAGFDASVGKFPFQALGKAQALRETEGYAQVVVAKSTGQILGAQVVGSDAASLIGEMTVAIENELTIDSITETIHAHPTMAEGWMEAAFLAIGLPLHLPPR